MIVESDVRNVLAFCAAHDPSHFPKAAEFFIGAWLNQCQKHPDLTRDDMIAAADKYYEKPDRKVPQPADVVNIALAARRDVLDRMNPDERAQVLASLSDAPRDEYGYVDKSTNAVAARVLPPADVPLPRGAHIGRDPAGWTYGSPTTCDERTDTRAELNARIREWLRRHPEMQSPGAAEFAIRKADAERAEKYLRASKRGQLADVLREMTGENQQVDEVGSDDNVDVDANQ